MKNNDVAFKIIVFLLSLGSTLWKKLIINYDFKPNKLNQLNVNQMLLFVSRKL